ncbi:MAG: IS30 family transposase [Gallionella sp.]
MVPWREQLPDILGEVSNNRTPQHGAAHVDVRDGMYQQVCGSGNSQIATLVERKTRYVMLVKVTSKDTETVINALIKHAHKLPNELYKSLTWDRGKEMADHKRFTLATDIKVYFCDPQNPWQRGTNENTNGLLRQYFPKGTDLSVHSQSKLNAVARQLNERPRKTLNFETPAERFNQCVASTG